MRNSLAGNRYAKSLVALSIETNELDVIYNDMLLISNTIENSKDLEGVIGFVPQDDLLFDQLSVYQNLYYAAKLCFSNLSNLDIDKLVTKTLTNLGLLEVKDLELLTMIQHFVSNIDLENSAFSETKKDIFFILKSTESQIIPILTIFLPSYLWMFCTNLSSKLLKPLWRLIDNLS